MALLAAAGNALLLTGDDSWLELPRRQQDRIFELGEQRDAGGEHMSLREHWFSQFTAMGKRGETFLVPYRYGDAGWFDWQPLSPVFPSALWNLSMAEGDWERIEQVRSKEAYDWREVVCFHNKEDCGHEQPWLRFLADDNPDYPERILQAAHQEVTRRLALVRGETEVGTHHNIHLWQEVNPVSSEALVQQTLGAPQPIYNGGLLHARLRYYDARARRPGPPPDVAALVTKLEGGRTVVRLVNLNSNAGRELVIQAGAYGEHRFSGVQYTTLSSHPTPGLRPTTRGRRLPGRRGPRTSPGSTWGSSCLPGRRSPSTSPPTATPASLPARACTERFHAAPVINRGRSRPTGLLTAGGRAAPSPP